MEIFWILKLLGVVLTLWMARQEEQRVNIKFLAQTGKNLMQVWQSLRDIYGNNTLSYPQVRLWHKRFLQGRETAKDNP